MATETWSDGKTHKVTRDKEGQFGRGVGVPGSGMSFLAELDKQATARGLPGMPKSASSTAAKASAVRKPAAKRATKSAGPKRTPAMHVAALHATSSRDEAAKHAAGLKGDHLKATVRELGLKGMSGKRVGDVRAAIVDHIHGGGAKTSTPARSTTIVGGVSDALDDAGVSRRDLRMNGSIEALDVVEKKLRSGQSRSDAAKWLRQRATQLGRGPGDGRTDLDAEGRRIEARQLRRVADSIESGSAPKPLRIVAPTPAKAVKKAAPKPPQASAPSPSGRSGQEWRTAVQHHVGPDLSGVSESSNGAMSAYRRLAAGEDPAKVMADLRELAAELADHRDGLSRREDGDRIDALRAAENYLKAVASTIKRVAAERKATRPKAEAANGAAPTARGSVADRGPRARTQHLRADGSIGWISREDAAVAMFGTAGAAKKLAKSAPAKPPTVKPSADSDKVRADMAAIYERASADRGVDGRAEAKAYLDELGLTGLELKKLAGELGVTTPARARVGDIKHAIIQRLVGSRLAADAVSGADRRPKA